MLARLAMRDGTHVPPEREHKPMESDKGRGVMKGSAALKNDVGAGDRRSGFEPGDWLSSINVRDFIVRNVTSYAGDEKFLTPASQRTKAVWAKLQPYFAEERKKGFSPSMRRIPRPCWRTRPAISTATMK